jgi:hypothetical protein
VIYEKEILDEIEKGKKRNYAEMLKGNIYFFV